MANVVEIVIKGVDKSQKALGAPNRSLNQLAENVARLKPILIGMASGAAGAFAIMAKSAINTADETRKSAQAVGVTTEALSQLRFAAELSGLSNEKLGVGLRQLSKNTLDMANGTGEARIAFEKLNLAVNDSTGKLKSADVLLAEIAEKFAGMEDGSEKTALAMRLFGESGAQMIPLLNLGAAGIGELRAEADKLGVTIQDKTGKAAEEFNDTLTRLKARFRGVVNQVLQNVLPTLTEQIRFMIAAEQQTGFFAGVVWSLVDAFKAASIGAVFITRTVKAMIQILKTTGTFLGNLAGSFVGAFELMANAALSAFEAIRLAMSGDFADAKNISTSTLEEMQGQLGAFIKSVGESAIAVDDEIKKIGSAVQKAFELPQLPGFDQPAGAVNIPTPNISGILDVERQVTDAFQTQLEHRKALQEAFDQGRLEQFVALKQAEVEIDEQALLDRQEFLATYEQLFRQAHRGMFAFVAQAGQTVFTNLSGAITDMITGVRTAAEAFKALGQAMVRMIVDFIAKRLVAFALEKSMAAFARTFAATTTAAALASATGLAGAWAAAATGAAIATLGGASAAAASVPAAIAANVSAATGIAAGSSLGGIAGVAHGGLTHVPAEATFLLQRGERVLSPQQNVDLTGFLKAFENANAAGSEMSVEVTVNLEGEAIYKGMHRASRDGRLTLDARSII